MPWINNSYKILTKHFGPELAGDIASAISDLVRGIKIDKVEFVHEDDGPYSFDRPRIGHLVIRVHSTGRVWPESVKFLFKLEGPMDRIFLMDQGQIKLQNCIEGLIHAATGFINNLYEHNPVFEFVEEEEVVQEEVIQ